MIEAKFTFTSYLTWPSLVQKVVCMLLDTKPLFEPGLDRVLLTFRKKSKYKTKECCPFKRQYIIALQVQSIM